MPDMQTVLRRYADAVFNDHDLDAVDDVIASDHVRHGPQWEGGDRVGRTAFKQSFATFFAVFPDLHAEIHRLDVLGEYAYSRQTVTGTHTGASFLGVGPTGNSVRFDAQTTYRLRDGKIVEQWVTYDTLAAMQQLGVVTLPPAASDYAERIRLQDTASLP